MIAFVHTAMAFINFVHHLYLQISKLKKIIANISSAENQKGVNAIQRCSVENQNGTVAIDFVRQ